MKPKKSFFLILLLIIMATLASVYLPRVLPQTRFGKQDKAVKKEPVVVDDSSAFNPDNAPFNFSTDEKFLDTGMFGFIREVVVDDKSGEATMKFDQALLYKGEEAVAEAEKDMKEVFDGNYYIRNPINKISSYTLSKDAVIKLLSSKNAQTGTGVIPSSIADLFQKLTVYAESDSVNLERPYFSAWIKVDGDRVNYLEEQKY